MSPRELVLAQREAYVRGWKDTGRTTARDADHYAAEAYPMPKVTRLREVKIGDSTYRVRDGVVEYRYFSEDAWFPSSLYSVQESLKAKLNRGNVRANDLAKIVELYQNPTETVEAE